MTHCRYSVLALSSTDTAEGITRVNKAGAVLPTAGLILCGTSLSKSRPYAHKGALSLARRDVSGLVLCPSARQDTVNIRSVRP